MPQSVAQSHREYTLRQREAISALAPAYTGWDGPYDEAQDHFRAAIRLLDQDLAVCQIEEILSDLDYVRNDGRYELGGGEYTLTRVESKWGSSMETIVSWNFFIFPYLNDGEREKVMRAIAPALDGYDGSESNWSEGYTAAGSVTVR